MPKQSSNPYEELPKRAFWRSGVAAHSPFSIKELWQPKHRLNKKNRIVTAGSCFAQHIGRALSRSGYDWFDAEPAPEIFDEKTRKDFNYGVFSFRTGNIYTTSALKQWILWAINPEQAPKEAWLKDGRYFDPFRPAIEPDGFGSAEEMLNSRLQTLSAIKKALTEGDRFVFTLGLTEGWVHKTHGYTYAMCPGTIAGKFDADLHDFRNFTFLDTFRDLNEAIKLSRSINPKIKFLLTVSPVPLTATASGEHVLTATTYSKSVLRAVAGEIAQRNQNVDYFPSYEIITAPAFRGMFYEPNMRSVHADGVAFVMQSFFECLHGSMLTNIDDKVKSTKINDRKRKEEPSDSTDDSVCEEVMLEAFSKD